MEFMIYDSAEKFLKEHFESLLNKYQVGLKTSMRSSDLWKSKTRVTSSNPRVMCWNPWVTSWNSRVTSWNLRVQIHELED